MPDTYLRFVTAVTDVNSGRRQGLFQAAYKAVDAHRLAAHEVEQIRELLKWFKVNLKTPDRFWKGSRRHAAHKAISWFKSSANEHLKRIRLICDILDENRIYSEMLTTDRPGYIVFEDEHQVAAIPFSETVT